MPGQAHAGTRVSQIARTIDVMPTILDALSVRAPAVPLQGGSLRPRWEGQRTEFPEAFTECVADAFEKKSVRTDRYKYIVTIDAETVARRGRRYLPQTPSERELYELRTDPEERHNLLAETLDPLARHVAAELDALLQEWLVRQGGEVERVELDDETIERLRALGYAQWPSLASMLTSARAPPSSCSRATSSPGRGATRAPASAGT